MNLINLPNTLTCCNLICGCVAAGCAFYGQYHYAVLMIITGAVFEDTRRIGDCVYTRIERHSLDGDRCTVTNTASYTYGGVQKTVKKTVKVAR